VRKLQWSATLDEMTVMADLPYQLRPEKATDAEKTRRL